MNEVIDYVMNTPGNTNPNVLRGMLQSNEGNSGGIFIVNVVHDETLNKDKLDKNYAEIEAAFNEGKAVFTKKDNRADANGFLSVRPVIGITSGVLGNSEMYVVVTNNELASDVTDYFVSGSATGVLAEPNDISGN